LPLENKLIKIMFRKLKGLCFLVGAYELSKVALNSGNGFYSYFIKSEENLLERYGGGYVLITGSTEGIGKEFARGFAKRGFNLILVSRNNEKLDREREELKRVNEGIDVKTIVYDFTNEDPEQFSKQILKNIENIDVSILVNNVGRIERPGKFEELSAQKIKEIINVNTIPQSYLSNFFLMKSKSRSNRSAIINLASSASLSPNPLSTIYSSTKTFNRYLSDSLTNEKSSSLDVLTINPGMVETPMAETYRGSAAPLGIEVTQPKTLVDNALRNLDFEQSMAGSAKHGVFNYIQSSFPGLFSKILLVYQLNIMSMYKN
jgi:17beta-estradiol 17-dehydrogenase / very-long-chain 3-oxoacyl-CoA reductase